MAEFLPLCDVLFNVISLAGYFCDIVFDMVFCYALLERGRTGYVGVVLLLVSASLVISQIVSLRWYLHKSRLPTSPDATPVGSLDKKKSTVASIASDRTATNSAVDGPNSTAAVGAVDDADPVDPTLPPPQATSQCLDRPQRRRIGQYCVIALHCTQLGVLWRYAKLFVPVDLRHVKHEVRDLCMLRLVHAFCEAAPMLLLQLHVLVTMQPEDYLIAGPEIHLKTLGGGGGVVVAASVVGSTGSDGVAAAGIAVAASAAAAAMTTTLSLLNSGGGVVASNANSLQPLHAHSHPLLHAIAAPTAIQQRQLSTFRDLNVVSAMLSLFSVCWALASFSKNVRLQNVHRLVLTWLGVIFQFLWRLGTVVSRVTALTVYASLYGYWIFLVLVLHWVSMFLWLISPKNVFHGERITRVRKATLAALIAGVYVFAYVNLQQVKHRQKMVTFYVVMFLENCLLLCLWLVGVWPARPAGWWAVPLLVLGAFAFGMGFMVLYYRYFHVRRLGYEAGGRFPGDISQSSKYGTDPENGRNMLAGDHQHAHGQHGDAKNSTHAIPGVFNCRFSNAVVNGATKRKKKKPTTFIPPPILSIMPPPSASQNDRRESLANGNGNIIINCAGSHSGDSCSQQGGIGASLMSIPFWRRPLPRSNAGGSSENEGSAGSRVNIQQKLHEKKQKQLAELKIIEEEIKQGKLGGPLAGLSGHLHSQLMLQNGGVCGSGGLPFGDSNGNNGVFEDAYGSLLRQPIPRAKKHINVEPIEWRSASTLDDSSQHGHVHNEHSAEQRQHGGGIPLAAAVAMNAKSYNDLSSANLDEVNNLNKYTSNYDPLFNSFGLNSINIPARSNAGGDAINTNGTCTSTPSGAATPAAVAAARNMSPISSQMSAAESNSLTRASVAAAGSNKMAAPRTKMLPIARNPPPSISPRIRDNDSPIRGGGIQTNHPRQISGTYSSSAENACIDGLPFPYNVVPPPRSKLDGSGTASGANVIVGAGAGSGAISKTFNTQQQQQQRSNALRQMQRAKTPEILLAPHYLDNSRIYYDWVTREQQQQQQQQQQHQVPSMLMMMRPPPSYNGATDDQQQYYQQPTTATTAAHQSHMHRLSSGDENLDDLDELHRGGGGHSDIDSQVSLPRSYTLPREFKYYRRNKSRKLIKNEHFINSTNSSDGDVDSGDDNESDSHATPSAVHNNTAAVHPHQLHQHQHSHHHHHQHHHSPSYEAAGNIQQQQPPHNPHHHHHHHHPQPPTHPHQLNQHQRALINQSQRRLRPPTAAVRTNNFHHNHGAVGGGSGGGGVISGRLTTSSASPATVIPSTSYPLHHSLVLPETMSMSMSVGGYIDDPDAVAVGASLLGHKPLNQHADAEQADAAATTATAAVVSAVNNAALNRQMRMRVYGQSKSMAVGGQPRHETKL